VLCGLLTTNTCLSQIDINPRPRHASHTIANGLREALGGRAREWSKPQTPTVCGGSTYLSGGELKIR
jgi:hypothetical protein